MPDTSLEDQLEQAAAKLKRLLDRHRELEEQLRWVDGRRSQLRKWCDEVDRAIAESEDGESSR